MTDERAGPRLKTPAYVTADWEVNVTDKDSFFDTIPSELISGGTLAKDNEVYSRAEILRKSGDQLFGNWAVDIPAACRSATRDKYVLISEIVSIETAGTCAENAEVVRISR